MKVLVTGHDGYLGTVLVPILRRQGFEVHGADAMLFWNCGFARSRNGPSNPEDIRDFAEARLAGFDALIHLAGISNDPLGNLDPDTTMAVNYRGAVELAKLAKRARVPRFLFASSCSVYGNGGNEWIDESSPVAPSTPYASSKLLAEQAIRRLADNTFSPVFFRNATAYGFSPRLRGDLAVNNLVAYAMTTGEIRLNSDGRAWRPFVHVVDIANAFGAALAAPWETLHAEVVNVGLCAENYRILEVAELIESLLPGTRIVLDAKPAHDQRNYRVRCRKLSALLPEYKARWTVGQGIFELADAYETHGLTLESLESSRFLRIAHVMELQRAGRLDRDLRWIPGVP